MKKIFFSVTAFFYLVILAQAQNTSPYWSLLGNSNASSTSKLGTTNGIALRLFTSNAERMRITPAGLVGIGTGDAITARLHIVSNYTSTTSPAHPLLVQIRNTSTNIYTTKLLVNKDGVTVGYNGSAPPVNGLLVNGNVAIGTGPTPPSTSLYKLHVLSSATGGTGIYTSGVGYGLQAIATNPTDGIGISGSGNIGVNGSGSNYGTYGISNFIGAYGKGTNYGVYGASTSGNGIAGFSDSGYGGYFESYNATALFATTTVGAYAAIFNGDTYTSGSYQSSDKKLKKNIQEVGNAMSIINKLKPRYYEFRDDGKYADLKLPKGNHYGLLAQDVEEVLPNLVKEAPHELKIMEVLTTKPTADGKPAINIEQKGGKEIMKIKAVNYNELIPLLIKAMQEQDAKMQEQSSIIEKQNTKIGDLTKLVNTLAQNSNSTGSLKFLGAYLSQNSPNPNSQITRIIYNIPANTVKAELVITNSTGQRIKQILLNNIGVVDVDTSGLNKGAYFYSLYLDGSLFETKKMVVDK